MLARASGWDRTVLAPAPLRYRVRQAEALVMNNHALHLCLLTGVLLFIACQSTPDPNTTPERSDPIDTTNLIAFVGETEAGPDVFLIKSDGTDERRIAQGMGFSAIEGLSWSPDGQQLAFGGMRLRNSAIYIINAD